MNQLSYVNQDYRLENEFDLTQFGPISLVVIQPTSYCNLDCNYCYLPNRNFKNQLSLDLIEPIFKTIFTSRFLGEFIDVCWHAGEPLGVPVSFYQDVFKRIERTSQKYNSNQLPVYHSLQTNGILINQDWCSLFKENQICVGVSIDGPAFLHDKHRRTRTGKGSHAAVMRGIEYLQKNEIPFNIIAVITEDSLNYPDEIFNFFLENGIDDIAFNLEETEGVNQKSSLDKAELKEKYMAFIQRFWQLTAQHKDKIRVREFEAICQLICDDQRLDSTDMNHPFRIVNIDYQGNFSTFDPELLAIKTDTYGDFILGNILTDTFESVCESPKFKRIYQDMKMGVDLCRQTCDYFGVCGGGAGSNKYWENGTFRSSETHTCRYRIQWITDMVLDALEESFGLV